MVVNDLDKPFDDGVMNSSLSKRFWDVSILSPDGVLSRFSSLCDKRQGRREDCEQGEH